MISQLVELVNEKIKKLSCMWRKPVSRDRPVLQRQRFPCQYKGTAKAQTKGGKTWRIFACSSLRDMYMNSRRDVFF